MQTECHGTSVSEQPVLDQQLFKKIPKNKQQNVQHMQISDLLLKKTQRYLLSGRLNKN